MEHIFMSVKDTHMYPMTITIKPNPDLFQDIKHLVSYMTERKYKFAIITCISDKGFKHYHGIFTFPKQEKEKDSKRLINTFRRYINKNYGFCRMDVAPSDENIKRWATYVQKHRTITEKNVKV